MIVSGVGLQNLNCKQRRQESDWLPGVLHTVTKEKFYTTNVPIGRQASVYTNTGMKLSPGALVDDEK